MGDWEHLDALLIQPIGNGLVASELATRGVTAAIGRVVASGVAGRVLGAAPLMAGGGRSIRLAYASALHGRSLNTGTDKS